MLVEQLTISPSAPARRMAASRSAAGLKRCCSTTPSVTSASRQAATSCSARAVEMSSGFSSRMCLPALASWLAISRCVLGGVRTATAVMLRSSRILPRLPVAGNGKRAANASRRTALGLMAYATSTRPWRSSRLFACGATAMPRPMRAMRWRVIGQPHPPDEFDAVEHGIEDVEVAQAPRAPRRHPVRAQLVRDHERHLLLAQAAVRAQAMAGEA